MTLDPDVVPSALAARLLKRRRIVVDVHEDYLKLLNDRAWAQSFAGSAARVLVRAATALSRRADLTVVADEHLPPAEARQRLVVRNLPDPWYLPKPSEPDPKPRAIYIGDVRTSRGLRTMLAAVSGTDDWSLDVVGPVHPADATWVERWLAESPAAERVRFHGRLDPARAWAVAEGAWAGLVLLEDTPAFREAVPSKLYEYLGCGLAVLATPLPRMAELVTASGAGATVSTAEEASDTLRRWSSGSREFAAHRAAARTWAAGHSGEASPYDELAQRIRALIVKE